MTTLCNHNANDNKTTILFNVDKRTMVYPYRILGICKECEEIFKFEKIKNTLKEIRDGDEDDSY